MMCKSLNMFRIGFFLILAIVMTTSSLIFSENVIRVNKVSLDLFVKDTRVASIFLHNNVLSGGNKNSFVLPVNPRSILTGELTIVNPDNATQFYKSHDVRAFIINNSDIAQNSFTRGETRLQQIGIRRKVSPPFFGVNFVLNDKITLYVVVSYQSFNQTADQLMQFLNIRGKRHQFILDLKEVNKGPGKVQLDFLVN